MPPFERTAGLQYTGGTVLQSKQSARHVGQTPADVLMGVKTPPPNLLTLCMLLDSALI